MGYYIDIARRSVEDAPNLETIVSRLSEQSWLEGGSQEDAVSRGAAAVFFLDFGYIEVRRTAPRDGRYVPPWLEIRLSWAGDFTSKLRRLLDLSQTLGMRLIAANDVEVGEDNLDDEARRAAGFGGRVVGMLGVVGGAGVQNANPSPARVVTVELCSDGDGIEVLDLGVRSYNILKRSGICTVAEVCARSASDLELLPNLGRRSIDEIKEALRMRGRSLRESDQA